MQIVHSIEASIPKISQSIEAVMCFDDPTRTRDACSFFLVTHIPKRTYRCNCRQTFEAW